MLTIDEMSIVKMYVGFVQDKRSVLDAMKGAVPFVEDEDIRAVMASAVRKVSALSEGEFAELDLSIVVDESIV
jgi:hypothetical protein